MGSWPYYSICSVVSRILRWQCIQSKGVNPKMPPFNAPICILLCMQIFPRCSPAGDASRTIQGTYIDPMHNAVVHGMMEHIISSGTVKQDEQPQGGDSIIGSEDPRWDRIWTSQFMRRQKYRRMICQETGMMDTQAYTLDLMPTGSIYFSHFDEIILWDIFTAQQSYPFSTSACSHSRPNQCNSICDLMYPCLIPQTIGVVWQRLLDIILCKGRNIEVDDVSRWDICMYNVDLRRRGWGVDGCEPWLRSINDIRGFDIWKDVWYYYLMYVLRTP